MFSIFDKVLFLFILLNYSYLANAGEDLKDDNIDNKRSDSGGIWFGPRLGKRALGISPEDGRPTFLRLLEAADALKYYYDQLQYANYESQADDPGMKVSKKVIFTPKLGRGLIEKRVDVEFRPRLGRRLSDDPATPADRDSLRKDDKRYDTVLFTPRVGKRLLDEGRDFRDLEKRHETLFTPRVGRSDDLATDDDAYRMEADQTESRNKYFSPRLGRAMNFSPRLGRDLAYDLYPSKVRIVRSVNNGTKTQN